MAETKQSEKPVVQTVIHESEVKGCLLGILEILKWIVGGIATIAVVLIILGATLAVTSDCVKFVFPKDAPVININTCTTFSNLDR